MCEKNTYKTRGAAIKAALNASRKRGTALRIYPCKDCHGFHLTKRPPSWRGKRTA